MNISDFSDFLDLDFGQIEEFRNRPYFDPGYRDKDAKNKIVRCKVEILSAYEEIKIIEHPTYADRFVARMAVRVVSDNRLHERNQSGKELIWDMPKGVFAIIGKTDKDIDIRGLVLNLVMDPTAKARRYYQTTVESYSTVDDNNSAPIEEPIEEIIEKPISAPTEEVPKSDEETIDSKKCGKTMKDMRKIVIENGDSFIEPVYFHSDPRKVKIISYGTEKHKVDYYNRGELINCVICEVAVKQVLANPSDNQYKNHHMVLPCHYIKKVKQSGLDEFVFELKRDHNFEDILIIL